MVISWHHSLLKPSGLQLQLLLQLLPLPTARVRCVWALLMRCVRALVVPVLHPLVHGHSAHAQQQQVQVQVQVQ